MPDSLLRRASEFTPQQRQAAEVLIGRPLASNERVGLQIFPADKRDEEKKELAWQRLFALMDKMAESAKDVPDSEFEEILEEAIDHVRHHPE